MRKHSIAVALGLCAVMLLTTPAFAQRKRTTRHHTTAKHRRVVAKKSGSQSGAETGLAGIKLFDSGSRVVSVYGSPDVIEAVTLGSSSAGPGGGAGGGGRGGPGLPGGKGGGGGPMIPGGSGADFVGPDDFGFGDSVVDRQAASPGTLPPPPMNGSGGGGPQGAGPGGAGGPGGGGGGDRVVYTRWVYNRNASKFGFIVDRFNHVVQCEAIGITAGKARTRRGITFGSSFAEIIKRYGAPDGYEIAGDNIVVRYLSKDKCAFRLSRLGENKPDVVTGIVVAAGKR